MNFGNGLATDWQRENLVVIDDECLAPRSLHWESAVWDGEGSVSELAIFGEKLRTKLGSCALCR